MDERQARRPASGSGDAPGASPEDSSAPSAGPVGPTGFEKELENLERAVELLERGDLDLEEAIRQYESGHRSLRRCHDILSGVEKRIEVLTRAAGGPAAGSSGRAGPVWRPFEPPPSGEETAPSGTGHGPIQ